MLKIVKDTDFEHTNIQNKIKLIEKGRKKNSPSAKQRTDGEEYQMNHLT